MMVDEEDFALLFWRFVVAVFEFYEHPAGDGRIAVIAEKEIVFFWGAQAEPFGLGGFENEGVEERV